MHGQYDITRICLNPLMHGHYDITRIRLNPLTYGQYDINRPRLGLLSPGAGAGALDRRQELLRRLGLPPLPHKGA